MIKRKEFEKLKKDYTDRGIILEEMRRNFRALRHKCEELEVMNHDLRKEVHRLKLALSDAAKEIPEIAGPVDHRIRKLREHFSDLYWAERNAE